MRTAPSGNEALRAGATIGDLGELQAAAAEVEHDAVAAGWWC